MPETPSDDPRPRGDALEWMTLLVDQQSRWRRGERTPVEEFLALRPQPPDDPEAVLELILHEVLLRLELGETPTLGEYQRRFPHLAEPLAIQFAVERAIEGDEGGVGTVPDAHAATPAVLAVPGYEITAVLGRGGMGVVYKARQLSLRRTVALKMLLPDSEAPEELARFRVEAEAVARLQHANIVQVYETGEWQGRPWFAMEYLEGGGLDKTLKQSPPSPRQAAEWGRQLALAVDAVHRRGILHRDLKPANVLLAPDGTLKISDFGLAKRVPGAGDTTAPDLPAATQTGAILGTPSYMAPEQAAGNIREVGPASDVYALGAMLYEMLTGAPPFRGGSPTDILIRVIADDPVPPRRLRPEVPRDLETICLKCLHKDKARRYPTALELADDLNSFLAGKSVRARPIGSAERAAKWARRRPSLAALLGVSFVLLFAGAGAGLWYWNAYHRVAVEYFANFVKRRGVPEGVGPLSESQAGRRTVSYRFRRRAGRVEAVEVVNGFGILTGEHPLDVPLGDFSPAQWRLDPKRECRFEYRRNERGELTEEVAYDHSGEVVWTLHYTKPTVAHFTDARGFPTPRAGSGAAYLEFVWSRDGYVREEWYLDRFGNRRPGEHGIWGMRRDLGTRGLPVRLTFLDANGGPAQHRFGFAAVDRKYDDQGNSIGEAYLDVDRRPARHKDGFSRVAMSYDGEGNMTERAYFGTDGEPVTTDWGYHRFNRTYDARGNILENSCWGPDGRPAYSLSNTDGFARYTCKYDDRGNRIEYRFFGADGRPALNSDGVHVASHGYDENNRLVELAFFDTDDRPSLHASGEHRVTLAYDRHGHPTEYAYFGLDGRPTTIKREGYVKIAMEYDGNGNRTRTTYLGADGKPSWRRDGYASFTSAYEERGNKVEEAYLGPDGKPATMSLGMARTVWAYDERGNQVEEAYFGPDGKPAWHANGYSRERLTYDQYGRVTAKAYFGPDGEPAWHKNGYVRLTQEFDDAGNVVATAFFGPGNKPALMGGGYARWTARFDARGNNIEQTYFGPDNKPGAVALSIGRLTNTFDLANNRTEQAYFAADGKRTTNRFGAARIAWTYDPMGRVLTEAFFDAEGKPRPGENKYVLLRQAYDERGRRVEEAYFDAADGPTVNNQGYARITYAYDARGNDIDRRCFGVDGKPAMSSLGHHRMTRKFDDRGNVTEAAFFGTAGQPVIASYSAARAVWRHDERGNQIREEYFDTKGQPLAAGPEGVARVDSAFDARGNRTELTLFGTDGRRTLSRFGISRVSYRYDDRNRMSELTMFDAADRRALNANGGSRIVWRYDDRNRKTAEDYFGVDDKPKANVNGVARLTYSYDERGRQTARAFGPDGKPVGKK